MSGPRRATIAVFAIIVTAAGSFAAVQASLDTGRPSHIETTFADDETEFAYDYVIPPGTGARIDQGEEIEIVPAELVVHVGEAIRIRNDDDRDHVVGLFFVAAGETLTQRFRSEGELSGTCTVHPSGAFSLRVIG